jgi:predicted SAM-dependent methyltransferase
MRAVEGARTRVVSLIRQSRSPTLWHAGKTFQSALMALRRTRWLALRRRKIQLYLGSHDVRKLELGTGQLASEGWLNTDIDPRFRRAGPPVLFLDVTRPFPFRDSMFDYITSEHVIEHVPYDDARFMLGECARVLRPGGRIRIATPDLAQLLSLYRDQDHPSSEQAAHLSWMANDVLADPTRATAVFDLNTAMREWDHQFLFDEETLREILAQAGFGEIQRFRVGESEDPVLTGRERHGKILNNEVVNEFETMCLEAVKIA